MKKKILAIILPIVLALAIGSAAFAVNNQLLSSTGTLQVNAEPGTSYHLDSTELNWGNTSTTVYGSVNIQATLHVRNIGTETISSFSINSPTYPAEGSGWNLTVSGGENLAPHQEADLTFTLTGTAPGTTGTINLNQVTCVLVAN